jgi:hypothetical protein
VLPSTSTVPPGNSTRTGTFLVDGCDPADLAAAADVYRSASLSNAGDRDNLLAHPEIAPCALRTAVRNIWRRIVGLLRHSRLALR